MAKFKVFAGEYGEKTDQGGLHMTFANGWTVSIQWRDGNHCDRDRSTAEIAAWSSGGDWYRFDDGNTVKGWVTPDDVVEFMALIAMVDPRSLTLSYLSSAYSQAVRLGIVFG